MRLPASVVFALGALLDLVAATGATPTAHLEVRQDPPAAPSSPEDVDECTNTTLTNPRWSIYELGFHVFNHSTGSTVGDFRFIAYNYATDNTTDCIVENEDLATLDTGDAGKWTACAAPDTEFRFNLTTFDLTVRQTWTCSSLPG
jgi:hypothetical protein